MKRLKAASILFDITTVFCFIYFALYIFTLVFIPIGIECFVAGRRFSYKAENIENTIVLPNKILRNWVIFVSIFCFPFGLLSIIAYFLACGNSVSVSTGENSSDIKFGEESQVYLESNEKHEQNSQVTEKSQEKIDESGEKEEQNSQVTEKNQEKIDESGEKEEPNAQATSDELSRTSDESIEKEKPTTQDSHIETEEEKLEKFKKLENFKEKGLITSEELEQAREQLFGKKED